MITIKFDSETRHRRSVLICVDKDYEPYAFLLIEQILQNTADIDFDVCLVASYEISVPEGLRSLPVRIGKLSADVDDTAFPLNNHVGFVGYFGIFATSVLATQYERLLILDADMLFLGRDLTNLFDIELCPGHAVGAVRDVFQQHDLKALPKETKKVPVGHFPYFNSGVMLVDTAQWNLTGLFERLLATIREHGDAFTYTDQSAWNLTLRGEWSELSWVWNWIYKQDRRSQLESVGPQIVHFAGIEKPWFAGRDFHPEQFVSTYASFLGLHYGRSLEPPKASIGREKKRTALTLMWRNFRTKRKLQKYRKRLSDPLRAIDPRS